MRHVFPLRAERPITAPGVRAELDEVMAPARGLRRRPSARRWPRALRHLRPELDLYLLTNESLTGAGERTAELFSRVFYRFESAHELHMTLLDGVRARHEGARSSMRCGRTPTSRSATSTRCRSRAGTRCSTRAGSATSGDFYGDNLFMAESSSTAGGLDSLLEPTGTHQGGAGRWRPAASARSGRSSSPTAPPPPTRSSTWRCCARATWCSSIATATSRITTGWRWRGRSPSTSTPIRCSASRSTAACRCARSSRSCSSSGARVSSIGCGWWC